MEFSEINRRLQTLIDHYADRLPPEQLEELTELVTVGEPGIALENYCTQLYDYDVAVAPDVVAEIETLGQAMGIDESYWIILRK